MNLLVSQVQSTSPKSSLVIVDYQSTLIRNDCVQRSSLITGLDCELDRWTGLLDWITGLTFWTKTVCITWSSPNQMCWIGSHVRLILITKKQRTWHAATVGVLCLRDLKGMHILQQMEQLGRVIGTTIYSKASWWPSIVFTWLHSTRLRVKFAWPGNH